MAGSFEILTRSSDLVRFTILFSCQASPVSARQSSKVPVASLNRSADPPEAFFLLPEIYAR